MMLLTTLSYTVGLKEARKNAMRQVKQKIKRAGYNYMSNRGSFLRQGHYKTFKVLLYRGNTYIIIGSGDKSVKDIDVQVYDKNWNIVAEDYKSSGALYAVRIKPKKTGVYYVRTCMFEGNGYYFQIIGWQ